MKTLKIIVLLVVIGLGCSCTQNIRAKHWGGKATEVLPSGQKLVTVTWKDADLWILTRPMKSGESAETYNFKESSTWGVLNGTVTIIESERN